MKLKKKDKQIIVGIVGAATLLVLSQVIDLQVGKPSDPLHTTDISMKEDQTYVKEDFYKGLNSIMDSLNSGDIDSVIKTVDSNVTKEDKELSSKYVLELVLSLKEFNGNIVPTAELMEYLKQNKVRPNKVDSFMNSSDNESMKKVYDEVKNNYYSLRIRDNESYVNELGHSKIEIDYEKILEKYSDYLNEEIRDYLLLKSHVDDNVYIDEKTVNFEALVNNISITEEFIAKYPRHHYDKMLDFLLDGYYELYFGYIPSSYVYHPETLSISDAAWKSYNETAKMKNRLGERAGKIVEFLNSNERKMSAELIAFIENTLEMKEGRPQYSWYEMLEIDNPHKDISGDTVIPGRVFEIDRETGEIIGELDPETMLPIDEKPKEFPIRIEDVPVESETKVNPEETEPESENIP